MPRTLPAAAAGLAAALTLAAAPTDPATARAVALFQQACLPYAANPAGLRSWAAQHHLAEFPPAITAQLALRQPARGYNASSNLGKLALLSIDNGNCEVVAEHGDATDFEAALTAAEAAGNISLAVTQDRTNPARGITQRIYRAQSGTTRWLLSVTAEPIPAAPGAPRITLLATPQSPTL